MTQEILVRAHGPMIVFKGRRIRRVLHKKEWGSSLVDAVAELTDNANARDYCVRLKSREKGKAGVESSTICRKLKLKSPGGKKQTYYAENIRDGDSIQYLPLRSGLPDYKELRDELSTERLWRCFQGKGLKYGPKL